MLTSTAAVDLGDSIVSRAEGVFLWVYIVVNELLAAASRGDNNEELRRRLDRCPSAMSGLFSHMVDRCDPYYSESPKPYLRLVFLDYRPTLYELLLASYPLQDLKLMVLGDFSEETLMELNQKAARAETQIVARCAGLVQFVLAYSGDRDEFLDHRTDLMDLQKTLNLEVQFIHKTARDFLREAPEGRAFLETSSVSEHDAKLALLLGRMALLPLRKVLKNAMPSIMCASVGVCGLEREIDHTNADNYEYSETLRDYSTRLNAFLVSSNTGIMPTWYAETMTTITATFEDVEKVTAHGMKVTGSGKVKLRYNQHGHGAGSIRKTAPDTIYFRQLYM